MTSNKDHFILVEKYRPSSLAEFVGNDGLKAKVAKFIETGDVPHLLLSGPAGTGKTTLSKLITASIECDALYINASDENNVDTMRNKIKQFASNMSFAPIKIIILDESDYLTINSQAALRNMMETFSVHTRFILTCNYVERIIEPIVSRTQQFHVVPPSKAEVAKHVAGILKKENVKFAIEDLKILVDAHYPDIRKIIQESQLYSHTGTLSIDRAEIIDSDFKLKIIEILASKQDNKKKFQEIRQLIANAKMRDYTDCYSMLYQKVAEYAPGHISQCILVIADALRGDAQIIDHEIGFCAAIIQLLQII